MKTYKLNIFYAGLLALSMMACSQPSGSGKGDAVEKQVEALLGKMTLQEKIGQMNQLSPFGPPEEIAGQIRNGEVGSLLNITDPAIVNQIQKVAVEESRLGIPLLMSRDVIHGYKTIFPIPLGQAATFNPQIVQDGARVAAIEASADGIRWTFAPMIDISRDPRWGRIAESCGEDPYLSSVMGVAMVKGFQGDSLNDPTSIAACAKHFIGYGAAEGGRDYNSTFIPERQLRNVYFPPFEAAAKAGCATFMTSFNDNDGIPSTGNSFILKDVLRDEWKYDGMVVTDWASTAEMISHGFCKDEKEAALKSVDAGIDMEMVSGTFIRHLEELVKEGKISEAAINNAVRNILRLKFRLGLFDNPYVNTDQHVKYAPEHLAKAKEAAEQSVILLKNDRETLPFTDKIRTIAVVGPLADAPHDQMGTWVFDGEKAHTQTVLAALKEMYGDKVQFIYEPGLGYSRDKNTGNITKAVSAATHADAVLVCVGEESILSGEAHSLADLHLQGAQSELITALAKTGKPLVTVIMAGRPLTIEQEVNQSDAVLYAFHPGTMGGPAIADLLFGKVAPSGKTPVTFPKMVGQIPVYYAHNNTGRPASRQETLIDAIPLEAGQTSLGCTSFYMDAGFDPLFPFGYGLSYTTFRYDNLQLPTDKLTANGTLEISFDLTNTGKYDGTEVVQLYVQDIFGSVTRPVKELKGFQRVSLKQGEKKTVTFSLPVEELAFWNIDMQKVVEPGEFNLWVGPNSAEGLQTTFTVE
ncbi:glycoside hydrolase family 3 N-terminal domain-containing protein [Parabacteroides chongii]|uniref:glycoside hydrolase family 3 N-terminal domain-containing protein n=1 Tax=Parabacteroides chongii TaxID=2685834 RepID=UPI00240CF4DE|nr:glycoside hydrolase family 3 N-terminal domain-containing protein [Parabacteroides chongii]WFE86022.1 glycoside hydrolase family 3 N-terminal domain-containing protein [Parabacteroides chongii]